MPSCGACWSSYRTTIRSSIGRAIGRAFVAQRFFYADRVAIDMERTFQLSAEAQTAIQQVDANATVDTSRADKVSISFQLPTDCPFAMDVIKGSDFRF